MNTLPGLRPVTTCPLWRGETTLEVRTPEGPGCAAGSRCAPSLALSHKDPPSTPSPDTCFPGPTGPGSGNRESAGGSPGPCQPPCAQTKPPPPGLWGGGRREREPTKAASGAAPGARATPSPTCPERPHPLLPLGRSAGAPGTVAMAAALGKLQLGNYCEHPSCLLPARESRVASSQGQGSPSSPAGWPHPGLARRHSRDAGEESRAGGRGRGRPAPAGAGMAGQETPPTFAPAPPTSGPPLELTNQPGTCFF